MNSTPPESFFVYVSDGYGNSRIAKFDKSGNWIRSWGKWGTGPGEFRTPHGLVVDDRDIVYVADRYNHRIQLFNTDGKVLKQWTHVGELPHALCITPSPNRVIYSEDLASDLIFKLDLDGNLLGIIGHSGSGQDHARDKRPGHFDAIHGITCPSENIVYIAEALSWRVQKLILHPESAKGSQSNR